MRLLYAYIVFIIISSVGFSLYFNGERRGWWNVVVQGHFSSPHHATPAVLSDSVSSKSYHMYRGNPQRQARYRSPFTKSLDKRKLTHLQATSPALRNFGIHSASKSSLCISSSGIFWPRDTGVSTFHKFNGEITWEFINYLSNYGFHGTAACNDKYALIGDYAGYLTKWDVATGKLQWGLPLGGSIGSSPLIDEDQALFISVETQHPDGFLAKVDSISGRIVWTTDWLGDHSHSSPALCKQGQIVVLGDNASKLSAFSAKDGKILWQFSTGGPIKGTPSCFKDMVLFSSWDQNIYGVNLQSGKEIWKKRIGGSNQSSFAITSDGRWAFINSSRGLCRVRTQTGDDLTCTSEVFDSAASKASPIILEGGKNSIVEVWSSCRAKNLCVYDGATLKILRSWSLPSGISGEPTVSQDAVWFVTDTASGLFSIK